jgi:hypothetical protein
MWTLILSIVSALIGLWIFYAKRHDTPTVSERIDDLETEYHDIIQKIHELREKGDNAGADAILRRLSTRSIGTGLLFDKAHANLFTDTVRKRMVLSLTQGKQDNQQGSSSDASPNDK